MQPATIASFLRLAAVVLLPLLLIGWAEEAVALPVDRPLSQPLRNPETYQAVREVSQHVSAREKFFI